MGQTIYKNQVKKLSNGVNKDYTGAPVQLSVYNDKLILWNEGRLPDDFTIETLLGKHPSRPANKNIADIFFKAGFIEAWGRGIAKIINGFTMAGLPAPEFEATMGGIIVTIKRKRTDPNEKSDVAENADYNDTDIKTDRRQKIIELIKHDPKITVLHIAKNLYLSKSTILREIKILKENGRLIRIGKEKDGYWEIP